jgi:hypothetical protein
MRSTRAVVAVFGLLSISAWSTPMCADEAPRPVVGLPPTYDISGEGHGAVVAQALQASLFRELRHSPVRVVLLNPGGGYAPEDDDTFLDLAREAGASHVVVTTVEPSRGRGDKWLDLQATAGVFDAATRARSVAVRAQSDVKRADAARYREFEGLALFIRGREFEKDALGKATRRLVETLALGLQSVWPRLPAGAEHEEGARAKCLVAFRVLYSNGSVSKTYRLQVNGRDESLEVADGVASLALRAGPAEVYVILEDPPRRLLVQPGYFFNTDVVCTERTRMLELHVGPAGEGRLSWRD